MSPQKPFDVLVEDVIETDIDWMIEQDHSEPEQLDLIIETE